MKRTRLIVWTCVLAFSFATGASAQSIGQKLLSEYVLIGADLRALGAFDTLASRYDRSEASVDTTVVINDSLWMSVLWISDNDTMLEDGVWVRRGGVCAYVFMMTIDPRSMRAMALKEIRTECDVDLSIPDQTYYSHGILAPTNVEVVSSKLHVWLEDGVELEELVPYEVRLFKVLPTGTVVDMGTGSVTGPGLRRP